MVLRYRRSRRSLRKSGEVRGIRARSGGTQGARFPKQDGGPEDGEEHGVESRDGLPGCPRDPQRRGRGVGENRPTGVEKVRRRSVNAGVRGAGFPHGGGFARFPQAVVWGERFPALGEKKQIPRLASLARVDTLPLAESWVGLADRRSFDSVSRDSRLTSLRMTRLGVRDQRSGIRETGSPSTRSRLQHATAACRGPRCARSG